MTDEQNDRQLLEMIDTLREIPAPNEQRKQAARRAFLNEAQVPHNQALRSLSANRQILTSPNCGHHLGKLSMGALIAVLVLAAALVGGGVTAYAANGSAPESPLYGLDRAIEQWQLSLTGDPNSVIRLRIQFAEERLAELEQVAQNPGSRPADIRAAVDAYGEAVNIAAQTLANYEGPDTEQLQALLAAALANHQTRLNALVANGQLPSEALSGIEHAIEASDEAEASGNIPESLPSSAPDDVPNGSTDNVPSQATGSTVLGTTGRPGLAAECATNLSSEEVDSLLDMAKDYRVDYEVVLELFCQVETLAAVERVLANQEASPRTVTPAGSPNGVTSVPSGSASGTSGSPQVVGTLPADTPDAPREVTQEPPLASPTEAPPETNPPVSPPEEPVDPPSGPPENTPGSPVKPGGRP